MEKKVKYLFRREIYDIYIVRHPEVENYEDNVFNGWVDVDLSKNGYKQAELLFEFFKGRIGIVYSSPLKRCVRVAEKFKNKVPVAIDDRLKERKFGIFESLSWPEIEKLYPNEAEKFLKDPFYYKPENGESFHDVGFRIESFLNEVIKKPKANMLIIAHGGINRMLLLKLFNLNEKLLLSISQDFACINHIQTDGEFFLLKLLNGQVCFDRCV